MVEAHGTGTPVGDPIEYASLAEVYGVDGPCALASVKTNFGHTQSAAGALGLMKAVLAVQHGVIPQNLHFTQLPDEFAQIETNLFVPQENTPWPTATVTKRPGGRRCRRTGSREPTCTPSSNKPPRAPLTARRRPATPPASGALLFPLSATSADGLRQTAGRLADWVDAQRSDLAAIGSGLHAGAPARAPAGAHRRHRRQPRGADRGVARGRRRRLPVSSPRSGRTIADRCGCSPGRVRSGRRWAPTCSPTNRCSPRPSPRSSR